jgi:hypothetical protein
MKPLRSLFALCALAFTVFTSVRADPVPLEQSYFYTDNTTDVEQLVDSYGIWGHESDDIYSFIVTYDFATGLDLDAVVFTIWYYDEATEYEASAWIEGPARNGGEGLSWLDGAVEISSHLTGTITVGVTFYFTDGSVLSEALTHELN